MCNKVSTVSLSINMTLVCVYNYMHTHIHVCSLSGNNVSDDGAINIIASHSSVTLM